MSDRSNTMYKRLCVVVTFLPVTSHCQILEIMKIYSCSGDGTHNSCRLVTPPYSSCADCGRKLFGGYVEKSEVYECVCGNAYIAEKEVCSCGEKLKEVHAHDYFMKHSISHQLSTCFYGRMDVEEVRTLMKSLPDCIEKRALLRHVQSEETKLRHDNLKNKMERIYKNPKQYDILCDFIDNLVTGNISNPGVTLQI